MSSRASWPQNRVRDEVESGFGRPRPTYPSAQFDETAPANARRLDAVEQLQRVAAEAGLPMAQLALGFVIAHPGVTSAIIGPRTMEQLLDQLPAGDVQLGTDVLDAIDKIVPPGTNLSEMGYFARELIDPARRRRPASS